MTRQIGNAKRSTRALLLLLLLVFSALAALILGSTLAFGASRPPAPKIVSAPAAVTGSKRATFTFVHGRPGTKLVCKLDSRAFVPCPKRASFARLAVGKHTVQVRAIEGGKESHTASYSWTVAPALLSPSVEKAFGTPLLQAFNVASELLGVTQRPANDWDEQTVVARPAIPRDVPRPVVVPRPWPPVFSSGETTGSQDFSISGNATGLLYPGGPAQPIALKLHNPNDSAISVTELNVAASASTPKGCSSDDLVLTQVDLSNPIVVPAGGDVTLPAQGVAAPTIRLADTGADQTAACANETFSLTYSGSAHS
jgi:hypothetical protein